MVRYIAIEPKPTEPSISQIEVDLLAEPALGADAHAVADDEDADDQLWIDRWAAHVAVKGLKLPTDALKVQMPVNTAQQVIAGDMIVETEIVEQSWGSNLNTHHRFMSPISNEEMNHDARSSSISDFFNSIRQEQSFVDPQSNRRNRPIPDAHNAE